MFGEILEKVLEPRHAFFRRYDQLAHRNAGLASRLLVGDSASIQMVVMMRPLLSTSLRLVRSTNVLSALPHARYALRRPLVQAAAGPRSDP